MKFIPTAIPEVVLIEPVVFRDPRGFFLETYHQERFRDHGIAQPFVQDNHSFSAVRGTLRGMHAQLRRPQGKLVRAILGEVFDVVVDLRPGSPTFGRWVGETLSGENFRQLYVPPGFAHGFCVVSGTAHVQYKCTELYDRADEIGLVWNDPEVAIAWPEAAPTLNERDRGWPRLAELLPRLEEYRRLAPIAPNQG
ncbi:MAG TPA: dTDP-4-dehydrorhamnose 3,5-epimerase [Thermoanaerobaculia bacterium]|nr:dTDP-4-dehydrorhamnose 3,5-epimerase [Thermoanaerobaculia bacterium]